ncbi:MFS transporter [Streptomyces sp. NPDC085614]|uniref:MFS transporter n=1 Tax=Streptomyces sp. NPDC085614 TaxID=3365733 RepID=UPI0037D93105
MLYLLIAMAGCGQLRIVFAAYAEYFHAGPRLMGLAYLANTVTVVLAQLPVLRIARRWRRTHILAAASLMWALTWLLAFIGGTWGHGNWTLPIIAAGVLAIGETLLAISMPALVNDIAPEDQRGRYNGSLSLGGTLGLLGAPLLTGVFLQADALCGLLLVLTAGAMAIVILCLRLEHRIPAAANHPKH